MSRQRPLPSPVRPTALCGHRFRDPLLLEAALTHPSATNAAQEDLRLLHQRLEFLGDAVWSFFISDVLLSRWPTASEGELTSRRAGLVSRSALAQMARTHRISDLVLLSAGEEANAGRQRVSILSGVFEAVIGAIYLDGGAKAIEALAREVCANQLEDKDSGRDPKTALQQVTQARFRSAPRYRVRRRSGPAHEPTFTVEVLVGGSPIGQGTGRNKQEAEQAAAREALAVIHPCQATTCSSGSDDSY